MGPSVTVVGAETRRDASAVRSLLVHSFETSAEADLVERLHHDGDIVLAMVATVATDSGRELIGYAAFPRLRVEDKGNEFAAVGLAPLAVAMSYRRQGVGTDLVDGGLRNLAVRRESLVFVLGDPAYYSRFGFEKRTAEPFTCVYGGPNFMAIQLADTAPRTGVVRYPAAFDSLG
jgi:putative acetyltransferase